MGGSTQGGSVTEVSSAPLFAETGASVIGSGHAESVKALSSSPAAAAAAAAAVTEASRLGFGLAAGGISEVGAPQKDLPGKVD